MSNTKMTLVKEAEGVKLFQANTFLIPILTGTARAMDAQYISKLCPDCQARS